MISSRNLDDQTFDQIVEFAVSRIAHVYPEWTDYNLHDPGITLLELFAWYKEMQQFHMNQVPDELQLRFLKLLGFSPRGIQSARVLVSLPALHPPLALPCGQLLYTAENVPFRLTQPVVCRELRVAAFYLCAGEGANAPRDISDILLQRMIPIPVFEREGKDTRLLIGLEAAAPPRRLCLYFCVQPPTNPPRNPFAPGQSPPRTLRYRAIGLAGEQQPTRDDTHSLSQSGEMIFDLPDNWLPTDGECGLPPRYYLEISQVDRGCEEIVRLQRVMAQYAPAEQCEIWAHSEQHPLPKPVDGYATIRLRDAFMRDAACMVFLEDGEGYRQIRDWEDEPEEERSGGKRRIRVPVRAQDAGKKLLVTGLCASRAGMLLWDSNGLPGLRLSLPIHAGALGDRRQVIPERFALLCDTLCEDGEVRPKLWRCVRDLRDAGKRDLVFAFDVHRQELVFGDGRCGQVLPRGKHSILVCELALTYASEGNLPEGSPLYLPLGDSPEQGFSPDFSATCFPVAPGREPQNVRQATGAFLRRYNRPCKCVTAEDYEQLAMQTPGLRIAAARAIPGYDPSAPLGRALGPAVTLVVIPACDRKGKLPLPDARFLRQVEAHINRLRTVGTAVHVIPPRYVGIHIAARVLLDGDIRPSQANAHIRAGIAEYFRIDQSAVGKTLRSDDITAAIAAIPGVLEVGRVRLTAGGADCRRETGGDIRLQPYAVAVLEELHLQSA